ncbi:MAG: ATP-binding protein [Betaproteobacteria bacterium]
MTDVPSSRKWFSWSDRFLPASLRSRIMGVMVVGVLVSQLLGSAIWTWQLRDTARKDARDAAHQTAVSAASAIRFLHDLPRQYRPLLIDQLRQMGGTRFFITVNRERVAVAPIESSLLADTVVGEVRSTLQAEMANGRIADVALAWPQTLSLTGDGRSLHELPESWVVAPMLLRPRPAPVLVIQVEFESSGWLLLAATLPDPYFLDSANPLTRDRLLLQAATLLTVLLLVVVVARTLTRPLQRIADAASTFGTAMHPTHVPETGTIELRRTARAFNDMQARIQAFVEDRERLFASISHDLKTPITRLKLRTELLDDDTLRADFHEDLDELDAMVKGALQSVKDSAVHENVTDVRIDRLVERLTAPAISTGAQISVAVPPIVVRGKPLALKRALGNLIDNGLRYGERLEISATTEGGDVLLLIHDHGPGLPESSHEEIFEPYVRLAHGRDTHREGSGLGLGIARGILREHGGDVALVNKSGGGLTAKVRLTLAAS